MLDDDFNDLKQYGRNNANGTDTEEVHYYGVAEGLKKIACGVMLSLIAEALAIVVGLIYAFEAGVVLNVIIGIAIIGLAVASCIYVILGLSAAGSEHSEYQGAMVFFLIGEACSVLDSITNLSLIGLIGTIFDIIFIFKLCDETIYLLRRKHKEVEAEAVGKFKTLYVAFMIATFIVTLIMLGLVVSLLLNAAEVAACVVLVLFIIIVIIFSIYVTYKEYTTLQGAALAMR